MSLPSCIGLCGPEGAGKSTVARLLTDMYGAELRPFAEPLKQMLTALGIPSRNLYGTPQDKLESLPLLGGKSARVAMQQLGAEWGRAMDADLWVRAWHAKVESAISPVVCDDCRFPNEAAAVRNLGGEIICVVRTLTDFSRKPKHASEDFASVKAKWILVNDGSLDDLKVSLRGLFGEPDFAAVEPIPAGIAPADPAVHQRPG